MNLYNAGKRYEVMTSHIFFEVKKKIKIFFFLFFLLEKWFIANPPEMPWILLSGISIEFTDGPTKYLHMVLIRNP